MSKYLLGSILLSVTATACMVEVDAPSIELERRCDRTADCTFKGIVDAHATSVPLELMSGSKDIPVDLESDGVLAAHYGKSVLSLDSTFQLDAIEILPLDDMSFDGVDSFTVKRDDGVMIAGYTRDAIGSMDAHQVMLEGNPDVNLLALGTSFSITLEGAGRLPDRDWMASLVFHLHANARAH